MTNIKIILFTWNSKYTIKIFLFIHTYYYWNNKHGNVKENVSCASPGIHLLSIFQTLGQKLKILLNIFCGTKITFEWISPLPPPIIMPYLPINTWIFSTHHYFEIFILPICNWEWGEGDMTIQDVKCLFLVTKANSYLSNI